MIRNIVVFPFRLIGWVLWLIRVLIGSLLWLLASRLLVGGFLLTGFISGMQTGRLDLNAFFVICAVVIGLHLVASKTWRVILPRRALKAQMPVPQRPTQKEAATSARQPTRKPPVAVPVEPPAPAFPTFSPVRQLLQPMPPTIAPTEAYARQRLSPELQRMLSP